MSSNHVSFPPLIFFFNDTATTEIYTLSLHDALPIYSDGRRGSDDRQRNAGLREREGRDGVGLSQSRSEEHTSELQSHHDLVCRLLLEKKKKKKEKKTVQPYIQNEQEEDDIEPNDNNH